MAIKVKICGMTRPEDAKKAAELGADAIGMILSKSHAGKPFSRYVAKDQAMEIADAISDNVRKVGVFVNEEPQKINQLVEWLDLDFVQLHGEEKLEDFGKINCDIIKAIKVGGPHSFGDLSEFPVKAFLFDGKKGGSGETWDFKMMKDFKVNTPWFLAGGLTPDNVAQAIQLVNPDWVDVSSGIEGTVKGEKDAKKMKQFIETVKKSGVRR